MICMILGPGSRVTQTLDKPMTEHQVTSNGPTGVDSGVSYMYEMNS
jgi:hypothetical protein